MDDKIFEKYTQKRKDLLKYYKTKKLKNIFYILGVTLLALCADIGLSIVINNIAVTVYNRFFWKNLKIF